MNEGKCDGGRKKEEEEKGNKEGLRREGRKKTETKDNKEQRKN